MRVRLVVAALVVLVLAAAAVVVVPIVLATTSTGSDRSTGRPGGTTWGPTSPTPSATPDRTPIRVAVVGDSLSAGSTGFLGNGLDGASWMTYAQGGRVEYVGGWAHAGATPEQMAAAVRPIAHVDVLVVLAGTNAVRLGASFEQERSAYDTIVRTVAPRRVIVSSIPPYLPNPQGALRYNRLMRAYVQSHGWDWFDAWAFARDGDRWKPGFSKDGVHPGSHAGYRALGRTFRWEILAQAGSAASAG